MNIFKAYGYIWVTLVLFIISIVVQWITHDGSTSLFINAIAENWQSEFLQLIWQILGLKFLLCVGSPSSKDEAKKEEAKLDEILEHVRKIK